MVDIFGPNEACESILSELRNSGLNFVLQETPYSAYITIRKKFRRGFQDSLDQTDIHVKHSTKTKEFEANDLKLKVECEELVNKMETTRSENIILQNRLAKAEEEMVKVEEEEEQPDIAFVFCQQRKFEKRGKLKNT